MLAPVTAVLVTSSASGADAPPSLATNANAPPMSNKAVTIATMRAEPDALRDVVDGTWEPSFPRGLAARPVALVSGATESYASMINKN